MAYKISQDTEPVEVVWVQERPSAQELPTPSALLPPLPRGDFKDSKDTERSRSARKAIVSLNEGINPKSEGINLKSEGINLKSEGINLKSEGINLKSEGINLKSEGIKKTGGYFVSK